CGMPHILELSELAKDDRPSQSHVGSRRVEAQLHPEWAALAHRPLDLGCELLLRDDLRSVPEQELQLARGIGRGGHGRMLTGPPGCTSSGQMSMNVDGHARLPHLATAGTAARPKSIPGLAPAGWVGCGGRLGCLGVLGASPSAAP